MGAERLSMTDDDIEADPEAYFEACRLGNVIERVLSDLTQREKGTEMPKFRKKPVEIEAYQVTEKMAHDYILDAKPLPVGLTLGAANWHQGRREVYSFALIVKTIHGERAGVRVGDWVITEPDNIHHYPCKPDIFEATYEPVEG